MTLNMNHPTVDGVKINNSKPKNKDMKMPRLYLKFKIMILMHTKVYSKTYILLIAHLL